MNEGSDDRGPLGGQATIAAARIMIAAEAVAWLALGCAALTPVRPGAAARVRVLAERGRLAPSSVRSGTGAVLVAAQRLPRSARLGAVVGALVTTGCAACGWTLGGPVLAVPFGLVAAVAWMLVHRAVASRSRRRRTDDLLRAVHVISGELSSGAGAPAALAAAAELGGTDSAVFAAAAATGDRGGEVSRVLLAARPAVHRLGQVWRIGEGSGAALALVLRRVADDLSAEVEQRRAVAVALAGPRSSATVVAGLPVLGLCLGLAMGADPFGFLTGTPAGRLVCAIGVVLDLAGIVWMARILRRAEDS